MKRELNNIKVSVALNRDHIIEGQLVDVSPSSYAISVAIPPDKIDAPPPGSNFYLCFQIPGLDPLAQILAVVINERDRSGKCILDLEVINWQELHRYLPANLSTEFNRRRHFRVSMPRKNETEVSVLLMESGRSLSATMLDISARGSKLSFASEEAPNVGDTLQIKFCLPTSEYQLDLPGTVTGQWEIKDARLCGVEFKDNSSTEAKLFLTQQEMISQYIMERQRELSRKGIKADSRTQVRGGETYNYTIDESDLIVSVDDRWTQFAQLNDGTELTRSAVIGRSIWDFIGGSDTRNLYRVVFERVRSENLSIKLPYRCDSPGLLRHMELEICVGRDKDLKLSGRLLRQENRSPSPSTDGSTALPEHNFLMCSLCKRVQESEEWINPEVVISKFNVFEAATEKRIEYSVCETCRDFVKRYA
jgi:hypothetical protein